MLASAAKNLPVADNAPGIPESNMGRVREPLFTTKSFGVGLGLPLTEKILEHHSERLDDCEQGRRRHRGNAWCPVEHVGRQAA